MDIVCATDDSERTRISQCLVVRVLHQHSHLAADALQACFHLQRQNVLGFLVKPTYLRGRINRVCMKQFNQTPSAQFDRVEDFELAWNLFDDPRGGKGRSVMGNGFSGLLW